MKNDAFNKVAENGNLKKSVRDTINDALTIVSRVRDDLPFDLIDAFLRYYGLKMVNEDGSDYEAIFTGTEGRVEINIARLGSNDIINNRVIATWHLYEDTGRYDFNCYIS